MSKEFYINYRIYYEDTDAAGVIYYANYLKFFERARTEFLRSKNINQSQLKNDKNIIFVVKDCSVNYIKPARLDDLITIKTKVTKIGGASIIMHQEIYHESTKKLLNKMDVTIVAIDKITMKPKKIPNFIREILNV